MKWLNKIRAKPQKEKLKIIWAVTIAIAVLLIVVWIISAKIQSKYGGYKNLFNNTRKNFNQGQDFYQKDLKEKGVEVPNKFNIH